MIIRIHELIYYQDGQGHGVKNTLGMGTYQIIQQPLFYFISSCDLTMFIFIFIYSFSTFYQKGAQIWQKHNRGKLGYRCK